LQETRFGVVPLQNFEPFDALGRESIGPASYNSVEVKLFCAMTLRLLRPPHAFLTYPPCSHDSPPSTDASGLSG
jgi:hypothetical protein